MTRKRFIKLLMAKGVSRNTAEKIPVLARKGWRHGYSKLHRGLLHLENLCGTMKRAADLFCRHWEKPGISVFLMGRSSGKTVALEALRASIESGAVHIGIDIANSSDYTSTIHHIMPRQHGGKATQDAFDAYLHSVQAMNQKEHDAAHHFTIGGHHEGYINHQS